jgi:hypothetical protein
MVVLFDEFVVLSKRGCELPSCDKHVMFTKIHVTVRFITLYRGMSGFAGTCE